MAEKPILFNSDMVRAILAGEKTRRVITPHPGQWQGADYVDGVWYAEDAYGDSHPIACPYGKPGDLLWVRETWRVGAWHVDDGMKVEYRADDRLSGWLWLEEEQYERLWQDSTDDAIKAGLEADEEGNFYWVEGQTPTRWRPSIFMPRWASRITLRITKVRVQRLQAISEDDAAAEGIPRHSGPYILDFARLWDSINAKRGYSWNSNPWVWVIEFEKVG